MPEKNKRLQLVTYVIVATVHQVYLAGKTNQMKAAVIYEKGATPEYVDFPEPVPQHPDETILTVKAVALKHVDRGRASGNHYSAQTQPTDGHVVGGDGVGVLADGTRVYAIGAGGMLAERAIIEKDRMVKLPAGLDDATAAALPNAVIGSAMALRFKAGIQSGDNVLINGATGVTGKMAIQIAKHYGAGKIIATGRNPGALQQALQLGADEIISLAQPDAELIAQFKAMHARQPLHIIIDYLWGHTAELLFAALKGDGSFTLKTRFVSIGSVTGDEARISAASLRSTDLQLSGSGLGSWTKEQVQELFADILPEMFDLAATGKLKIETTRVALKDIAALWKLDLPNGSRLVVTV